MDIKIGKTVLQGDLTIPSMPIGLIIFAHGSGSSRLSPRNQLVARKLNEAGFATLLFDLLTKEEEIIDEKTKALRFDIPNLAQRLVAVTEWIKNQKNLPKLPIGYFGASTGAAAALIAASQLKKHINAVVSRGGRPDLAQDALKEVRAATLLIVGGRDLEVLSLNDEAYSQLTSEKELAIVEGATHLFEERGALEEVVNLATNWFIHHLSTSDIPTR